MNSIIRFFESIGAELVNHVDKDIESYRKFERYTFKLNDKFYDIVYDLGDYYKCRVINAIDGTVLEEFVELCGREVYYV